MKFFAPFAIASASMLSSVAVAQQALTIPPKHRYKFDNAAGTLAAGAQLTDSIGTAHGAVRGTGASALGAGIRLTGGASATAAYLDFPNGLVSGSNDIFPGYTEASYELWITVYSNQSWSRILDFGNNAIDEVTAPGGTFNGADYLIVSANIGTANNIRFERGGQYLTGGAQQDIAGATTIGTRMHIVATYDATAGAWKLYKNGTLISTITTLLGPGTIDDLNVWLGRSNWAGDSNTDATYDEFRTYDYALTQQQILGNYNAGPDLVTSDNLAPSFTSNPFTKAAGKVAVAYSATIAGDATDPNAGDSLTYSKTAGPAWLTVAANGALSGTPPAGSTGVNAFTVRATDLGGLYAEATLNITVNANQAPVFTSNPFTKPAGTTVIAYSASIAADASDPENAGSLTFSKLTGPSWLTVASTGALSGTPPAGSAGVNAFGVRATDVAGMTTDATLNITISNNQAPVFSANPLTKAAGKVAVAYSASIATDATDPENGGTITFSKVSGPAWLTVASNGALSGTPPVGSSGPNAFVVRATDVAAVTADATLNITVNDNGAPVFVANPLAKANGATGAAYTATLAGDATDPENAGAITYSKVSGPAWLAVASSGALTGTPPAGSGGLNAFTVKATDVVGMNSTATLNITVNNVLPAGWSATDVGSTGLAGSSSEGGGTYSVSGVGADIGGSADGFQFAYRTLTANGEMRLRVTSQTGANALAKAGLMIRESTAAGSRNALLAITPGSGFLFQSRLMTDGPTSVTQGPASNAAPNNWVRLTRSIDLITAYVSSNGTTWTQVGTVNLTMPETALIGFAVSSHDASALSTATFDNPTVTPYPSPWLTADVGPTGTQGTAEYYGAVHTVKGAGTTSNTGTSDAFRYVYQTLYGNGTITVRMNSLGNSSLANARVGIMMRESLAPNAPAAFLSCSTAAASASRLYTRSTSGGAYVAAVGSYTGTSPNFWIRLTRNGTLFTAEHSTDGSAWVAYGLPGTLTLSTNCYVGLVVSSGSTSTLNTTVFDNVSVSYSGQAAPLASDADGDGMKDSWEAQYYSPSQFGAQDDPDGDGVSNHDEYAAGTNPNERGDRLKLRVVSASPALLEFNGKGGRTYTLMRLNTTNNTWEAIKTIGPLSADGTTQTTDAASQGRDMYRLKVEASP